MFKTYFAILGILILLSCDHAANQKSSAAEEASSNLSPDNSIDSSAFELLVSRIEDPERKNWQNPELVINELGNLEGKIVADIGAGTGYFTFRLAPLASKVIAIDIDKRFLDFIDDRKPDFDDDWIEKIETRLTVENDPSIAENEVDAVLIVNTYHFLKDRVEYLKKVRHGLKKNGIILIVDFKQKNMEVAPPGDLVVPSETTVEELKASGFNNIDVDQMSLKYQYIIKATN